MVSSVRREPRVESLADALAWLRARPWYYPCAVLMLWALIPGVRRVIDWKTSFSSVSLISVVPLLSLLPAAYAIVLTSRAAKLGRAPLVAGWLWLGAFGYAYAIGIVSGNLAAASYTFAGFALPMCFGMYLTTLDVPMKQLYEHVAGFALALSVPVALYSIVQYAFPPPWDLLWIQQSNLISVGNAAPLAFRPFSTLNGPGIFADFLVGVLVLNFPRMRALSVYRVGAIALDVVALALTLVRADWIALALALLTFVVLSPRRVQNLSLVAVVALATALFAANAGSLFGSAGVSNVLQSRLDSLTSITTDDSYQNRSVLFGDALATAFAQPTGEGLGVVGTAAKLGSHGATVDFDNGYIARFTEMGYFGMAAYLATIAFTLVLTLRAWSRARRSGDSMAASIAAAAAALQVALVFLDAAGDHHGQLGGLFYWLSFALVFAGTASAAGTTGEFGEKRARYG
jgi:hypothetical protein